MKFEEVGISRQYDAGTIEDARKAFRRSCECCCERNMPMRCETCSIAYVHRLVCACISDAMHEKNLNK